MSVEPRPRCLWYSSAWQAAIDWLHNWWLVLLVYVIVTGIAATWAWIAPMGF